MYAPQFMSHHPHFHHHHGSLRMAKFCIFVQRNLERLVPFVPPVTIVTILYTYFELLIFNGLLPMYPMYGTLMFLLYSVILVITCVTFCRTKFSSPPKVSSQYYFTADENEVVKAKLTNREFLGPYLEELVTSKNIQVDYLGDIPKWCSICGLFQPDTAEHCYQMNRCVPDHFHHCSVLNCCVTPSNQKCFLLLFVQACLLHILWLTVYISHILLNHSLTHFFSINLLSAMSAVTCILLITGFLSFCDTLQMLVFRNASADELPILADSMSNEHSTVYRKCLHRIFGKEILFWPLPFEPFSESQYEPPKFQNLVNIV